MGVRRGAEFQAKCQVEISTLCDRSCFTSVHGWMLLEQHQWSDSRRPSKDPGAQGVVSQTVEAVGQTNHYASTTGYFAGGQHGTS